MSEIKKVSPLLDDVELGERFSERGQTECFYCERIETGEKLVLKHIAIPESDTKVQALILTGAAADEAAANEYFRGLAEDLRAELAFLASVPETCGVNAWLDYQIEAREGVGFDVYALMPRKDSLRSYLQDNAITQLQALNLGLDLCDAMGNLNDAGYAYFDLKPENVFVDARKRFTIGDLGLMQLDGLEYSAVPEEHINEFSAPELSKLIPEPARTSDQYSLGMLLFYVFNGNRLPFEDEKISAQRAVEKRLNSDILPSPQYADYELAEIISKACSRDPAARYASFAELKQALTLYMQRNEVSDQLLVPPLPEPIASQTEEAAEKPDAAEPGEELPEAPQTEPAEAALPESPEPEEAQTPESGEAMPTAPVEEPEEAPEEAPPEESEDAPVPEAAEEPEAQPEPVLTEVLANVSETTSDGEAGDDPALSDINPESADGAIKSSEDLSEPALAEEVDLSEQPGADGAEETPQSIEELLASVNNVLSEEDAEPEIQAPDLEANEAAANEPEPKQRRKKKWLPLLIGLLILALIGAALAYFYSNWYLVKMDGLEVTDRTADSITVTYQLSTPDPELSWDCIDTYGNTYAGTGGDGRVQFTGLEPSTQYTIRFFPGKLHKLTGTTTASAATATATQIVSMTAVQAAVNTTAEVSLVVSGPEPEKWVLTYSSKGSDSGSVTFSGHSVEIPNLQLHDVYTFELTSPEDVYLAGQTSCEMTVAADVQAKDLQVSFATDDSLTVTWQNLADAPKSWSVRCVGEGYDQTQDVTDCVATFQGIRLDTAYTFTVNAEGLEVPLSVSLPANARIVTDFSVEPLNTGSIQVKWASTDPQPEGGWVVRYSIGGDPELGGSVGATEENAVVLNGMPANAEIVVSLEPKDGQSVIGNSTLTTETLEAEAFSAHEFIVADCELNLYAKPAEEQWGFDDLGDSIDTFAPGAEAAVVLAAPEGYRSEDEDATAITLAVRGENGKLVQFRVAEGVWREIFTDGRYLTALKLTDKPGSYQLELYFDGKLVSRRVFTVEGDSSSEEASSEEEAPKEG